MDFWWDLSWEYLRVLQVYAQSVYSNNSCMKYYLNEILLFYSTTGSKTQLLSHYRQFGLCFKCAARAKRKQIANESHFILRQ